MFEHSKEKLLSILSEYGIYEINEYIMKDSSHGGDDLRHNYIIDNRYVLRVNSTPVMTEERIKELNSIIKTYNEFGIVSPYYIPAKDGTFIKTDRGYTIYLSEYLDMKIAYDLIEENPEYEENMKIQRLVFISRFAEQFKNKLESNYYSMYSVFDLSPYDIPYGVDEKQQNLDDLCNYLIKIGENGLVEKLSGENTRIRAKLLPIYKELPHCVFQGDENFSNICVDEQNQIAGLFDFNMSGMDINANYLANSVFIGGIDLDEDIFNKHDAKWAYYEIIEAFYKSRDLICKYYHFTDLELKAFYLYAKINMFSSFLHTSAFQFFLNKPEYKEECMKLIDLILDWDISEDNGQIGSFVGLYEVTDEDISEICRNYVKGIVPSEEYNNLLIIHKDGRVRFEYHGTVYEGKMLDTHYYGKEATVNLVSKSWRRFAIGSRVSDLYDAPTKIYFYSEGVPATNVPSTVSPIKVYLTKTSTEIPEQYNLPDEADDIDESNNLGDDEVICPCCKTKVKNVRFCSECGAPLKKS